MWNIENNSEVVLLNASSFLGLTLQCVVDRPYYWVYTFNSLYVIIFEVGIFWGLKR